jgi:hypothetical protein
MKTTDTITSLRTQLAERRVIRQRSRKLEAELASFSTPAERLELDAILNRHTAAEVAELEAMLSRASALRIAR